MVRQREPLGRARRQRATAGCILRLEARGEHLHRCQEIRGVADVKARVRNAFGQAVREPEVR